MVEINDIKIGNNNPFVLMAGPCVVESEDLILRTAESIQKITEELEIPLIFKSSYKKANRTSMNSFSGLGDEEALKILMKVKESFGLPIVTDTHSPEEARMAAEVADILQIPAFLCRQTELLVAAGETGKVVNIKKGQFLAPPDMKYAADKVESTGNKKILMTERGTTFGYGNLVVDMRALVIMRELGYPVVMDATHSVQMPGAGGTTGGDSKFIPYLTKAATAVGIDALFLEVHPDPPNALSDAKSQLPLSELKQLLIDVKKIDEITKK
ncbi:MAG: 3-deoxy-8-phosphooctulonate synthase [Melioribacteraceae bacterium]|nr:3-deoxy-8-phosphooctulonate synthase [Melioribacteraceae bacterium]MCF8264302.1 3-deoxy-8-phosphooctulonate synthase [Melioribacteraceae bacterium]MCF8412924.1 3-deoxy-8-phosphooctulonate synthase [Melioribacteraceae bacterium]MCF8432278.1 3-deoxy-8-phosphooctulonate synthase [Melioribacteraceae bacterium]